MSEFQVYAKLNGEDFAAWDLNKKTHQGIDFTCPYCNSIMRPVMGPKRRWHFRHLVKGVCSGGGESEFHFKMKYWFVEKAKEHSIKFHVEKSVKYESLHRPDVILYLDENEQILYGCFGVAIEFQNSPIDIAAVKDRNITYLNQKLTPWWVFGGSRYQQIRSRMMNYGVNNDVFQGLLDEFRGVTFLEGELSFIVSDTSGTLGICNVDFLRAFNYHKGEEMPILEGSLSKYSTKRCGFFIKKGKKWISYPSLLSEYLTKLDRRIESNQKKVKQIKSKVYGIKKLREINHRLHMIDIHPNFYTEYVDSYIDELSKKGQIKYQESVDYIIGLGINHDIAINILEYLLRRDRIFKQERFLQSVQYWEKRLEKKKIILENKSKSVFIVEKGKKIQVPLWLTPKMEEELMAHITYEIAIPVLNCMGWLKGNVDMTMSERNAISVLQYLVDVGKVVNNPKDGMYYPARQRVT